MYIWLKTVRIRKVNYTLQSNTSNEAYILVPLAYFQDGRLKYKDSSLTEIDHYSRVAKILTRQL